MVTKKKVTQTSKSIVKQAQAMPATITKQAKGIMKDVNAGVTKAERKVSGFIRENPKKAAAIAVGVGAAIGAVAASAMRGSKKK